MGLIQNLLRKTSENKREFKQKFKQAEEEHKINRMIQERQMSSNERELRKHIQDLREQQIKAELDKVRMQRNRDNWKSPNSILKQKSILTNDRQILKEKNIFANNRNIFLR